MIRFTCPTCAYEIPLNESRAGTTIRCPMCKTSSPVPAQAPTAETTWNAVVATEASPEKARPGRSAGWLDNPRIVLGVALAGVAFLLAVGGIALAWHLAPPAVAVVQPTPEVTPTPTPTATPTPRPEPGVAPSAKFTVEVSPAEAEVVVFGQGATLTGSGATRSLEIAGRDGSLVALAGRLPGYSEANSSVVKGTTREGVIRLRLEPLPARIVVKVDPPGATLTVDAKEAIVTGNGGEREIAIADPTRVRSLLVRVQLAEHESQQRRIDLTPGSRAEVTLKLERMGLGGPLPGEPLPGGPEMPRFVEGPLDPVPYLRVVFDQNHRIGINLTQGQKRLTYSPDGGTNNTCLMLDGQEALFQGFGRPQPYKDGDVNGWRSQNVYLNGALRVTQDVSIRRGEQSRKLDVVRVGYTLENLDGRVHQVGLRAMVDTLIGGNDGVPFTIPGRTGLCDTTYHARLPTVGLPDYLQVLERPNLTNPGTVAQFSLRVPALKAKLDPPDELLLAHWPGSNAGWQVADRNIGGDSAVMVYWTPKALQPRQTRDLAYTYGLGSLSSGEGGGSLALTVGGLFQPGAEFIVVAYVNKPERGMTIRLDLSPGLSLVDGVTASQEVPFSMAPVTQVSWRVKADREGKFDLKAALSSGAAQSRQVVVRKE